MGLKQLGINHLSYNGIVKIAIKDNKGRTKENWKYNSGTPALGLLICKSLIRGSVGKVKEDLKPYKIDFIARGDKGIGTSLITGSVQITNSISGSYDSLPSKIQNEAIDAIGFVKLSSEISPSDAIILDNPRGLQLVIQDKHGTPLAYIDDEDGIISEAYSALRNQSVKIDWYLLVMNSGMEDAHE